MGGREEWKVGMSGRQGTAASEVQWGAGKSSKQGRVVRQG